MAWNGSNGGTDKPIDKRQPDKGRRVLLIATAAALVVVIAGVVIFGFGKKEDGTPAEPTEPVSSEIKEVPTAQVAQPAVPKQLSSEQAAESDTTKLTPEQQEKLNVIRRRQAKLKELRKSAKPSAPYAIFEHPSENRIAELLTIEPGTPVLLPMRVSERFEADFLQSCKEPILIKPEDSDFVKALKQDMIDCKIEIANRMAAGEKLQDILSETQNELRKLGEIKTNVMRMMRNEIRANALSEDDVDTYIEAANKLLESKGIAPMKDNPVLRRCFHRAALKNAQSSGR